MACPECNGLRHRIAVYEVAAEEDRQAALQTSGFYRIWNNEGAQQNAERAAWYRNQLKAHVCPTPSSPPSSSSSSSSSSASSGA